MQHQDSSLEAPTLSAPPDWRNQTERDIDPDDSIEKPVTPIEDDPPDPPPAAGE